MRHCKVNWSERKLNFVNRIEKYQIKIIQTIISQKGLREEKEQIIRDATAGRSCHVSDLFYHEAVSLISFLNGQKEGPDRRQAMFNHIIAMANEMGWIRIHSVVTGSGIVQKKNYDDLHSWVMKFGYLKKPMNDYTYMELPTLVTQYKNVYTDWLHSQGKDKRKKNQL
jgi:hypothetical protein